VLVWQGYSSSSLEEYWPSRSRHCTRTGPEVFFYLDQTTVVTRSDDEVYKELCDHAQHVRLDQDPGPYEVKLQKEMGLVLTVGSPTMGDPSLKKCITDKAHHLKFLSIEKEESKLEKKPSKCGTAGQGLFSTTALQKDKLLPVRVALSQG